MTPRSIRNNNPLNIRHSKDHFQGETKGTDKSFKTFSSMEYGYRAAFTILATYNKKGANTIQKIITRWAPPTENNTQSYITQVEKWSGIPRNKPLTTTNGTDYIQIVAAMSLVESGINPNIAQIKAALNLQTKITIQKTIPNPKSPLKSLNSLHSSKTLLSLLSLNSLLSPLPLQSLLSLLLLTTSCKPTQYLPPQTTKTQYQTNHIRDSIYLKDSILIHQNGDTTIIEKYQYFYKDKLIQDSVHIHDTTRISYPVEVIKQVKKPLTTWQNFQIWCGRITLILLLLTAINFIKKRK